MLRGAELVRVAEGIGGKLSFHDCTLLLTRREKSANHAGSVAQIVAVGLFEIQPRAGGAHRILSDAWQLFFAL